MGEIVLIVVDERKRRKLLQEWVSKLGYQCMTTGDLKVVRDVIHKLRPTAAILDLKLIIGSVDAVDFLGWLLAEQAAVCSVPILIVTGYAKRTVGAASHHEEGVAFFDKHTVTEPVFQQELLRAIQATQQRKSAQDQKAINTAQLRQLLKTAYNEEELSTLCYDAFPSVLEQFSDKTSFTGKIQCLIVYCVKHKQMNRLLARIKNDNPARFAESEALLYADPDN